MALPSATILTLYAMFCFAAAIRRHFDRRHSAAPRQAASRIASIEIGISGALILVSITALIGIWTY